MNSILTDNVPAWTNKEVLVAFGSAAATLIPATFALFRFLSSGLRHRLSASLEKVRGLERMIRPDPDSLIGQLSKSLDDARNQLNSLKLEKTEAQLKYAELERASGEHRAFSEKLSGDLDQSQAKLGSEQRRITKALRADGFSWNEKVLSNVPEFRPLDERRMPIISVLNLKGGVGKTTLTANLGAALERRGWKVLLIDLDLQGSLTNLFLPEQDQLRLRDEHRLIGDYLSRSFDSEFPNLLDFAQPVLGLGGSALVGTVDNLAYAETNLTMRWLLREGNRDPRFILRRELHLKRISNTYDIVLLDCPPLINVSCVNALAASDSVLIPVMPSRATTDRVPFLLERLKQFLENINSHLKVLGIVANRTNNSELTVDELNRLTGLDKWCKDCWGDAVPRLKTIIRQSTEVRMAEDERRPLGEGDKGAAIFDRLAEEVEGRLPTFCTPSRVSRPSMNSSGVLS